MSELAPITSERDDDGRWLVGALHAWGKAITHAREPATAGGEYLLHPLDVGRLRLGDCDDVLRAQSAMAMSLGLVPAALVWDFDGGGAHVSTIVSAHSYADVPVWVIERELEAPGALSEFGLGGTFGDMAAFSVVAL